ncbi:MBL fold metallo-hydrolase [Candidatus Bathyarchaeota archaeon]|nr:MBL fold metallo-hydrolase [Candidatus Bathyarchaeota archaeon]MBS7627693.1 MBL fold metallo-hydrolase [Candidatus Bathyarchaeota archaeon]
MIALIFLQIPVGTYRNFAYILADEATRLCVIVDPDFGFDKILRLLENYRLKVKYIIGTHSHPDHIFDCQKLASRTGAKVIMHKESRAYKDQMVEDGDILKIGTFEIRILYTPGHTPDSICLLVDEEERKLLTGDTLFVGGYGRTDLQGGNPEKLYDSLFEKILKLGDDVEIYPGHDYGDKPSSTIGREKRRNQFLNLKSKEEFLAFLREGK